MASKMNISERIEPKGHTKLKWWQAALFLIAANAIARLAGANKSKKYYKEEKKPVWAPPAAVFGPAWLLNNIAQLWGNARLLDTEKGFPNRRTLMALQALTWIDYISYSFVAFRLRSNILSLIWTNAMTALAIRSMGLAWKHDKGIALSLVPLSLWGLYASALAGYIAYRNGDDFFHTPAPEKIVKESKAMKFFKEFKPLPLNRLESKN